MFFSVSGTASGFIESTPLNLSCNPPDALCLDLSIDLPPSGSFNLMPDQVNNGSTADCGIDSIFLSNDYFDCSNVPSADAYLILIDSMGQTDSCSFTVSVIDNSFPVINSVMDMTLVLEPLACTALFEIDFIHSDNCFSQAIIQSGPEDGDYLEEGVYECQWAAFDNAGNIVRDTFAIEVLPVPDQSNSVVCDEDIQINLDETGEYTLVPEFVLIGGPYGCVDNYLIQIEGEDDMVDCNDIGEVTATLEDLNTGNFCTISISINDNYLPQLVSVPSDTFNCSEGLPSSDDPLLLPAFEDNCGLENVQMVSQVTLDDNICDGMRVFRRSWVATDINGNDSETVEQLLYMERVFVEFPLGFSGLCSEYEVEDLTPTVCGMPNILGSPDCGYGSSYSDVLVTSCGDLNSIVRTWAVIDWCTNSVVTTDINGVSNVQLITVEDNTAPEIGGASVNIESVDACLGLGLVTIETIIDDCQSVDIGLFIEGYGELAYTFAPDGSVSGGSINTPGLELGEYELLITATDACGNYAEKTISFEVVDNLSPVALCEDEVKVSLNSLGEANLSAALLDDGSFDNCCLNDLLVRREDSDDPLSSSIFFDCDDVSLASIPVQLYVDDCNGNSNNCQMVVTVFDEQAPVIEGPSDMSMSCELFFSLYQTSLDSVINLDLSPTANLAAFSFLNDSFGSTAFSDNCSIHLEHEVVYSIDDCGNGEIRRNWSAKDSGELPATEYSQLISIQHEADWTVEFPADWEGVASFGCTGIQSFGEPQFSGLDCEQLSASFNDVLFLDEINACYRIVREWTVINSCSFDADLSQDSGTDLGARTFHVTGNNYKTYLQSIRILDTEISDVPLLSDTSYVLMGADCDATLVMPFPQSIDCELLTVTIDSDDLTPFPTIGGKVYFDVPPGEYSATYIIEDLCGNEKEETIKITMKDGLPPSILCPEEHIIILDAASSGSMVQETLSVDQLSIFNTDNCSLVDLKFQDLNGAMTDELIFDCEMLGHHPIVVSAKDEHGNQSFCTIKVLVKDDLFFCEDNLILSGLIQTVAGAPMNNVELFVEGLGNTVSYSTGEYMYAGLIPNEEFLLEPSYQEDNPLNGVTTLDVVVITKHILNLEPFDDSYKFIAADANFSNSVTTLDIVKLQRMILGIDSDFAGGISWRFVDTDFVFDPFDVWTFPEFIIVNSATDNIEAGFTGIKIGDLNASASLN